MGEEELGETAKSILKAVEEQIRRYEIALLSYEGSFSAETDSPYERQPFNMLPEWQQEWHYRVADLIVAHGYKKIG